MYNIDMISSLEIDIGMILIAAIANMGLGMLWYSKSMFGKRWAKLIGLRVDHKPKDMSFSYSVVFVGSLLMAFSLEMVLGVIPETNGLTGLLLGFWAGIGLVATTHLATYLFDPNHRPIEVYFINVGYYAVSLMLMGFLLAL